MPSGLEQCHHTLDAIRRSAHASSAGKPAPHTAHPGLTKDAWASLTDCVAGAQVSHPQEEGAHPHPISYTPTLYKVQL